MKISIRGNRMHGKGFGVVASSGVPLQIYWQHSPLSARLRQLLLDYFLRLSWCAVPLLVVAVALVASLMLTADNIMACSYLSSALLLSLPLGGLLNWLHEPTQRGDLLFGWVTDQKTSTPLELKISYSKVSSSAQRYGWTLSISRMIFQLWLVLLRFPIFSFHILSLKEWSQWNQQLRA